MRSPLNPLLALRKHPPAPGAGDRRVTPEQDPAQQTNAAVKDAPAPIEDADLCWIYGAGRSGSTWLLELLHGLNETRTWNEPYFGRICVHLHNHPAESEHSEIFFSDAYRPIWLAGIRNLFLNMANARFGTLPPGTKLIIKYVNSPELCPYFAEIFPRSRYLLLLRDPFDILDSHLDMQRPGGWNESFARVFSAEGNARMEGTARYVRKTYETAIASYEKVAPELRLEVRYEDLLADTVESLAHCAAFLGLAVSRRQLQQRVQACRFEKHKDTGQLAFRRFGKAGVWRTSGNFTEEVTQIATETLGDLRRQLHYTE